MSQPHSQFRRPRVVVPVALQPDMAARLKRLADREDAPQSVVIRRALANLLDQVDDTPRAN